MDPLPIRSIDRPTSPSSKPLKRSTGSLFESAMASNQSSLKELKTLGEQLLSSREHINNLPLLLTFISPSSLPQHVLECILTLQSFFTPVLPDLPSSSTESLDDTCGDGKSSQNPELVYRMWLRSKFDEFVKSLISIAVSSQFDEALRDVALDSIMEFVKLGKGGRFQSGIYHGLLGNVAEIRIHLINRLGNSEPSETSDLASLIDCLTGWTFWDGGTGLDLSRCMLNKSILHVATKYLEEDISGCVEQFLSFGIKASEWCGQHLNMIIILIEESREEKNSNIYLQLVLNFLSFAAACFSAVTRSTILGKPVIMFLVEKCISEQLKVTKASISEIKRIQSVASEVLKVAQLVLDAALRLCKAYSDAMDLESCSMRTDGNEEPMDSENIDNVNHVINIIKCTVGHLCELGILAAADGGSLVSILNVSWKGVVTLLQLVKGVLSLKINVAEIILTLLTLITNSLRGASESCKFKEDIGAIEAKRTYLPVKFYLINAVRISSQYTCQAFTVYREITLCLLMLSTFKISLSKESHFKAASEALTELLEPSSILLLHNLLNSAEVKQEAKLLVLDWLFSNESPSSSIHQDINRNATTSMDEIFTVSCEVIPRTRLLMLGRVSLFLNLLNSSPDLGEDTRLGISRKLGWLFDLLIEEDAYSTFLTLHVPLLYGSGTTPQLTWQAILSFILHSLKTFIVVAFTSICWEEVECFLLENFFHPHFLFSEIILELWSFIIRHAEIEMVYDTFDKIFSIFKFMASSEQELMVGPALRRMARSICILLTHAPDCMIDRTYTIVNFDGSPVSSVMYITLLMEGFPLNLLSHNLKVLATQKIVTEYFGFSENIERKLWVENLSSSCSLCVFGAPVYALSCAMSCLQIGRADVNVQTLKFAIFLMHGYKSARDSSKEYYCELLSHILGIISNLKHLYASDEMEEVVFELHSMFVMDSASSATCLYRCKPNLSLFMAGLGHMEIVEGEGNTSATVWELYNMLLRERHWAVAHLAITSFGYFAAHTSCNQLWRFVPPNAALSFNVETGSEANEDRFMSELKAFLEKDVALLVVAPCPEQVAMLLKEGEMLKVTVKKILSMDPEDSRCEVMEIDDENQATKKRKLPSEIGEGMALLQSGSKVLGDGLALWRQQQLHHGPSTEWQEEFSNHFSQLEDVIASLVSLTGDR